MAQNTARPRHPASRPAAALLLKALPPPALCGFLVLLVLMGGASYAVGRSVGPVAPGMHGPGITRDGDGGGGTDSGGTDGGGMDGGGMDGDGMNMGMGQGSGG